MSNFRKLGIPLIIIFVSAFVTKMIELYLGSILTSTLNQILIAIALCVFGAALNPKGRSKSTWKKVIAILIVIFLLFMQLGLFTFSGVTWLFNLFGVDAFYINMLYIFAGYMMVD